MTKLPQTLRIHHLPCHAFCGRAKRRTNKRRIYTELLERNMNWNYEK